MMEFKKADRLHALRYDIRGPVYEKALALQAQGISIINLNIGNPAPFGFDAPDEIVHDILTNIRNAQGYTDSRGLFAARKAVMQYTQSQGIKGVSMEDVFIGNGVSELILMSMQALLNPGDEVLVPAPDYPLWTTAVGLSAGKPVHYLCDEENGWQPNLADLEAKISAHTKGIVLINPNNPTGAVYSIDILKGIVALAEKHGLILFSDEIYDKILYKDEVHHPLATLAEHTLCVTFGGLSKNYRAAGFRGGWLVLSGAKLQAVSYAEGLLFLASARLCANVPTQFAIQTALGGYQSIQDLVLPTGRLYKQMELAHQRITSIEGLSCVPAKGALYLFPKIDLRMFDFKDDNDFVYKFLCEQRVLLVAGNGFNYPTMDHFRVVILPNVEILTEALDRLEVFMNEHRLKNIDTQKGEKVEIKLA